MNGNTKSIGEDLAFLRALAEGGDGNYRGLAEGYLAAGIIYGGQMLFHAAQGLGLAPQSGALALAGGIVPTIVFAVVLTFIVSRNKGAAQGGVVAKSVGAMFAAVGLANLALIAVIGSVALREHSLTIWLIYPCTVFVLQGAAWLAAFMLRRRVWLGLVAAGWFATGVAMAVSIEFMPGFILFAALGLFGCMALPGYLMLRQTAA